MTREEMLRCLQGAAEALGKELEAIDVALEENESMAFADLLLRRMKFQFVLTLQRSGDWPPGTLLVRVFLQKNDPFYYQIPELLQMMDLWDPDCYYFSWIESEERFHACFEKLASFLREHRGELEALAEEPGRWREWKLAQIREVMGDKGQIPAGEEEFFMAINDVWLSERFLAFAPYDALICQGGEAALRAYGKVKYLTPYEKRLVAALQQEPDLKVIGEECNSRAAARKALHPIEDLAAYLFAGAGSVILLSLAAGLLIWAAVSLISRHVLFADLMRPRDGIYFGLLPGMVLGWYLRDRIRLRLAAGRPDWLPFVKLRGIRKPRGETAVFLSVLTLFWLGMLMLGARPCVMVSERQIAVHQPERIFAGYTDYRWSEVGELRVEGEGEEAHVILTMQDGNVVDSDFFAYPEDGAELVRVLNDHGIQASGGGG